MNLYWLLKKRTRTEGADLPVWMKVLAETTPYSLRDVWSVSFREDMCLLNGLTEASIDAALAMQVDSNHVAELFADILREKNR